MKKILIYLTLAITTLITGCTSLEKITPSTSSLSQEKVADSVDAMGEYFATGSEKIGESGQEFAKQKALADAKKKLKTTLVKESEVILRSHMQEVNFYDKGRSKKLISELSEVIANNSLSEAREKNSWIEGEKLNVVLTVQKSAVQLRAKNQFIDFIDQVIERLKISKSSIESIPIASPDTPVTIPAGDDEIPVGDNIIPLTPEEVTSEAVEEVIVEEVYPEVIEVPADTPATDSDFIDVQL